MSLLTKSWKIMETMVKIQEMKVAMMTTMGMGIDPVGTRLIRASTIQKKIKIPKLWKIVRVLLTIWIPTPMLVLTS